mgnify:CR=1 FL=1
MPSYEELQQMDEEMLDALGTEQQLEFPDSFDSLEALRDWMCEQLGIEAPPPPAAAGKADWRAKLRKQTGAGK